MQAKYPLKIQAIRSKNQQARLYVYFPLPLAAAIGLKAGEEVQWELLDRGELHLQRCLAVIKPAFKHGLGETPSMGMPQFFAISSQASCVGIGLDQGYG